MNSQIRHSRNKFYYDCSSEMSKVKDMELNIEKANDNNRYNG